MARQYQTTLILNENHRSYSNPFPGEQYKLKIKISEINFSIEGIYYPENNKLGYSLNLITQQYSKIFQDVNSIENITILNESEHTIAKNKIKSMIYQINNDKYILEDNNKNKKRTLKKKLKNIEEIINKQ